MPEADAIEAVARATFTNYSGDWECTCEDCAIYRHKAQAALRVVCNWLKAESGINGDTDPLWKAADALVQHGGE